MDLANFIHYSDRFEPNEPACNILPSTSTFLFQQAILIENPPKCDQLIKDLCHEVSVNCDDFWCRVICRCCSWLSKSDLAETFRALHVFICWQAQWRYWFPFPAEQLKLLANGFLTIALLDWDLDWENLWAVVKRRMRNTWRIGSLILSFINFKKIFHQEAHLVAALDLLIILHNV